MSLTVFHRDSILDWACCDTCVVGDAIVDEFKESEHPRGAPENAGEFVAKGQGAARGAGAASAHLQPANPDRAQWPTHIQALRVPPAWTNVHMSADPDAALQVVGQDAKGRKQYVYHHRFAQSQAEAKFARIKELDQKFNMIQSENKINQKSNDPVTREHADATALVMGLGVRPGSEEDTKADKQAFGATTLQGQHVVNMGDHVRLRFTGKKGVDLDLPVDDPALIKMLKQRKEKAGPEGQLFPRVSASSLLDYVHGFDGGGFKTKDMRTLLGTRTAMQMVAKVEAPTSPTEYKKAVKQVATEVSQKLGNTPTVALQSYINPTVFAEWRQSAGI